MSVEFNAVELLDEILELESQQPKDQRRKEYKEWKEKINELMKKYNKHVGWKCFKPIK